MLVRRADSLRIGQSVGWCVLLALVVRLGLVLQVAGILDGHGLTALGLRAGAFLVSGLVDTHLDVSAEQQLMSNGIFYTIEEEGGNAWGYMRTDLGCVLAIVPV